MRPRERRADPGLERDGRCLSCARGCDLATAVGHCGVRRRVPGAGVVVDESVDLVAVQPVETKLFHFTPGAAVLTAGSWGCGTRCGYCRNADTALRRRPGRDAGIDPDDLPDACLRDGIPALAFSWNEPIVRTEMLVRVLGRARRLGLDTIVVSSGWATDAVVARLAPVTSAWRIDLKAGVRASAGVVLGEGAPWGSAFRTAACLRRLGVHVELSVTIAPAIHAEEELGRIGRFVAERLSPETAMHLQALLPAHRITDFTPLDTDGADRAAAALRRGGLRHVYVEHPLTPDAARTTRCACGTALVERGIGGVTVHVGDDAACPDCGRIASWLERGMRARVAGRAP